MQEKLAQQRREIESRISLVTGSFMAKRTTRGRSKLNVRNKDQAAKSPGKPATRSQASKLRGRKGMQKKPSIPDRPEGDELDRSGNLINTVIGDSSGDTEMVDEEIHMETVFNEAFEELNDEISDDVLEELFNDVVSEE